MIPRYAVLTLLDNNGKNIQALPREPIIAEDVLKQFNLFYEKCIAILEKNDVDVPIIKDELDKARDEFTTHLT